MIDNNMKKLLLILVIIALLLGISSGALYPYTSKGWYYISEALKQSIITGVLAYFSWKLFKGEIIVKLCLVIFLLSLNQCYKELFTANPNLPPLSDYMLLIFIIIIWIPNKFLHKFLNL